VSVVAAVPVAGVALVVAVLVGASLLCMAAAVRPPAARRARDGSTPGVLAGVPAHRLATGAAAGFVTLAATRWLVLAAVVAAMVVLWGRLLHDRRAEAERRHVEAIAAWLEDLRDTLRASSVGAEEALELVAERPPAAIAEPLHRFALRRRQGFRLEDALVDLGDDLAHPVSDAAVAAIRLVVSGSTGGGRLYGTVDALASAARDEVGARERVDRARAVYQQSMKRLVVIAAVLVAYLRFAAGDLLTPYGSAVGQVVLLVPLAMWVGCVLWLRSLCTYELPRRYSSAQSRGTS
jgi:hypothetical protein